MSPTRPFFRRRRAVSVAVVVASVMLAPPGAAVARAASPVRRESVAVLLVSDPSHRIPISVSDVARYSKPFLDSWYGTVSYGTFKGFTPAHAASVTEPDGVSCDPGTMWNWALANYPRSAGDYVVVVPGSACPATGATAADRTDLAGHHLAFFTDRNFVHTASPSADAVYNTVMELGHSLLGSAHANSLDCAASFTWDCYSAASSIGPLGGVSGETCARRDGTVPHDAQICAYGDAWDAMGDDFPESAGHGVGTVPGDAWLNGIELDKAGWLARRERTVAQGVWTIRPLEASGAGGAPQALWIPAIAGLTPDIELEYRHPPASGSPLSPWLDGFLTGCVSARLDCGWPEVTGGVLVHARAQDSESQSLLLDNSPNSNHAKLCPSRTAGGFYDNAFCDWYDAAVQPGVSSSFVPGQTFAPYYVTVLSANARRASVAVNFCPCQDPFSPVDGDFGTVSAGTNRSITFTLTNTAQAVTHTISNARVTGADADAFAIASNDCGALAPGASCHLTITFTPNGTGSAGDGAFDAKLVVADSNPVFPTESVALTGLTPVTGLVDFTWTGAAPADQSQWSNASNWAGSVAPAGAVGVLNFSHLSSDACAIFPWTDACYDANNDIAGLSVDTLTIEQGAPYHLSGNPITLNGGGLEATSFGGGGIPVVDLPITLGAPQQWTFGGFQTTFGGDITGTNEPLTVALNRGAETVISADAEVGPVSVVDGDPSIPGGGGDLEIAGFSAPAGLNATDGHSITVNAAGLTGSNATFGPLTVTHGNLTVGLISPLSPGSVTVNGAFTLADASMLMFVTPTDYSQLTAKGDVTLSGTAGLNLSSVAPLAGCGTWRVGNVDTLIRTSGSLSGTFFGLPDGATVGLPADRGCPGATVRIEYGAQTVTATVVSAGA